MIFAKDLLLKGAAGLALCAGLGAGGWYVITQNKEETLHSLAEKVGLNCTGEPTETTGVQCTKKNDSENIKVKKGNDANSTFDVTSLPTSGTPLPAIKVYKAVTSEEYNKDFKFVIEGGDITGTNSNKLEEFETYEIVKDSNTWYLTRKDESFKGIRKALGLPEDCNAPTTESPESTCALTVDKLKLIEFEGKGKDAGDITVENASDSPAAALNLKIRIPSTEEGNRFTRGYKFTLESNKDITIPGTSNSPITIKKGTNTEFKIKTKNSETGGARTLTLEKAWSVEDLAGKVGLESCDTTNKTCSLKANSVNVHNGDDKKYTGTSKASSVSSDKKVKYEENVEDFNQGFRFYVEDSDISLDGGNAVSPTNSSDTTNKKIEQKGSTNVFYEVKKGTGDDTNWYLTKKSTNAAA